MVLVMSIGLRMILIVVKRMMLLVNVNFKCSSKLVILFLRKLRFFLGRIFLLLIVVMRMKMMWMLWMRIE